MPVGLYSVVADFFLLQKAILWAWPASIDDFVVEKGKGTLTGYEFGKKTMVNEVI